MTVQLHVLVRKINAVKFELDNFSNYETSILCAKSVLKMEGNDCELDEVKQSVTDLIKLYSPGKNINILKDECSGNTTNTPILPSLHYHVVLFSTQTHVLFLIIQYTDTCTIPHYSVHRHMYYSSLFSTQTHVLFLIIQYTDTCTIPHQYWVLNERFGECDHSMK